MKCCESEWGTVASLSVEGEMLSTNLWEVLWRCFRRGGRELGVAASTVIVYLQVFSTRCLFLLLWKELTASPRRLPRVSTRSDITRHWYVLMLHILPSGPSMVVKKNNKTREAVRRHTRTHTKNKTQVQVTRASRVTDQGCSWLLAVVLSFVFNTCVGVSKVLIAR